MFMTINGMRDVQEGAVLLIVQDSNNYECWEPAAAKYSINSEFFKPAAAKVCRICLVMDKKLFPIKNRQLEKAYEHLTGQSISAESRLPQQLCAECIQRLLNCYRFRAKSLRAHSLLVELLKRDDNLSIENIKSISRENNKLNSNLTMKTLIDHFDVYINGDNHSEGNRFEEEKNDNDEMKEEYSISLNLGVTAKSKNGTLLHADFNYEDDDIKDDYSLNDSLPSNASNNEKGEETKRTARGRKRKVTGNNPMEACQIDRRRKPFYSDDLNEEIFTITDWTIEEHIADIEKRKESSNFKNANFRCMQCYKGFLDKNAYSLHMSRHTTECGEHRCTVCKTYFKNPRALRKHTTANHTQRFSCRKCFYITTYRQAARLHEEWHKGTKYKCPHCSEEFVKFSTCLGHIRIKHPSDFVCQVCGFSFVSDKGINQHMMLKHRLENAVIPEDGPLCELCNLRFVSAEALQQHINVSPRHHVTDKRGRQTNEYKAKKTDITVQNRTKKKKHQETMPCEQCGVQLESVRAYFNHFRRMHPDKNRTKFPAMRYPCMCEVCGKMFQSRAILKDHRWVHTGERPFSCDVCGKSFRMKQQLGIHRRLHKDHKPTYDCDVCGRQFSTNFNMQRHVLTHTGLKHLNCEVCGKGFKHSGEKRSHILYVHLKKPWPKKNRSKKKADGQQGKIPLPVED